MGKTSFSGLADLVGLPVHCLMKITAHLEARFRQAANLVKVTECARSKYSSQTPERVNWFLDQTELQPLSRKEASKRLK